VRRKLSRTAAWGGEQSRTVKGRTYKVQEHKQDVKHTQTHQRESIDTRPTREVQDQQASGAGLPRRCKGEGPQSMRRHARSDRRHKAASKPTKTKKQPKTTPKQPQNKNPKLKNKKKNPTNKKTSVQHKTPFSVLFALIALLSCPLLPLLFFFTIIYGQ